MILRVHVSRHSLNPVVQISDRDTNDREQPLLPFTSQNMVHVRRSVKVVLLNETDRLQNRHSR
ncbi:hypothetical protein HYPGJ_30788 [Hyphomicrobium sp. GJ21]|nr:hypothetical protein HYPGJ_30788 [Hyphomicrobium sp. GJ21]